MTHEQQNDYIILSTLAQRKFYTKRTLAVACAILGADSHLFATKQGNERYITITPDPDALFKEGSYMPGVLDEIAHWKISLAGENYLRFLTKEKEKEDLEIKLKRITIGFSKFQQGTIVASLLVAAIALFTPFLIRFIDRNKIEKTSTEIPQLQQLMQTQEQISKDLIEIKGKYLQDTSIVKMKVVK